MSRQSEEVVVVGGGVIGASCAYYLLKAGCRVTLLERGAFGRACSHANCGYVCPSHVLPLAVPGAVRSALKALLSRNSAFSIKPRLDWALWSWLYRFARRCNARDMLDAGRAIAALLNSSRGLYEQILKEESIECEWQTKGLLFVFQQEAALKHYEETDQLLRDHFLMGATSYDSDGLAQLEPALKPGLAGGYLYQSDAHLRPDRLMLGLRRVLEEKGARIVECCDVNGWVKEHGKAIMVETSQGQFAADAFIVATGAWTPLLAKQLGCAIPIQPGKGYSITMSRPDPCPTYPLIFEEHRVAITPMQTGYRIGSTMEFAGYDASLNRQRLDLLREGARYYLREPFGATVEEEWFGWRPMTYDSLPIIDRSPVMANVHICAGHNMLGLSMAPASGKIIAEVLTGATPHVDVAPYRVGRF